MASAAKHPANQAAANEAGLHQSGRQITIMRAAQQLDDVLPGWTQQAIANDGSYHPFNLTMPLQLPGRANPQANWAGDAPISEHGKAVAIMVGQAMRATNIAKIVTSPALHCVQTAKYIIQGMDNQNIKIQIEPGFYDWLRFQTWPPKFMSPEELRAAKMPIDEDYEAVMNIEDLTKSLHESPDEFTARKLNVAKQILEQSDATEHVLLIAHASTIETVPRRLEGIHPAENIEEGNRRMEAAANHYPPCAMVTIKQTSDGTWHRTPGIIPPFCSRSGDNILDDNFYYGR